MNPETKIIDLLCWIQERGFSPKGISAKEKYLCPITRTILPGKRARGYGSPLLWIPSLRGAKRQGVNLVRDQVGSLVRVRGRRFEGVGPGEPEAMLSMFNEMRRYLAA